MLRKSVLKCFSQHFISYTNKNIHLENKYCVCNILNGYNQYTQVVVTWYSSLIFVSHLKQTYQIAIKSFIILVKMLWLFYSTFKPTTVAILPAMLGINEPLEFIFSIRISSLLIGTISSFSPTKITSNGSLT